MKHVFAEREAERIKLCSNGANNFQKVDSIKIHWNYTAKKKQLIFLHIYNTYYFI